MADVHSPIYDRSIVIDMHNDMPTKILDDGYDPDVRHAPGVGRDVGHTDLPRLIESGVTAVFLVAWVDAAFTRATPDGSFARAAAAVDVVHAFVGRHPTRLIAATVADDVRRAKATGRIAVFIGVEGGHAIEGSLERLRTFHARGVRYLTLTWNNGNAWAGSSVGLEGTRTEGLTAFGRTVIAEMNRLGMLVDVSHASDATVADVLETSTVPVIASHSSARALADHPRNLTDAQLRWIAADHVGLGSDFDGMSALPEGVGDVTGLPRIADALLDRGYAEAHVARILGGNMLRLLDRVLIDRPSRTPTTD
jgi:membrane dipeptidase